MIHYRRICIREIVFLNEAFVKSWGILLLDPAGTGKTLVARTICSIFNVQPNIVRGSQIFSCFPGESEKKTRTDAQHDQETFGSY